MKALPDASEHMIGMLRSRVARGNARGEIDAPTMNQAFRYLEKLHKILVPQVDELSGLEEFEAPAREKIAV